MRLFLFILLINVNIFSQIYVNFNEAGDKSLQYSITIKNDTPILVDENGEKYLHFVGANLEDEPGKPALPQRTLIFAIPPDSKAKVEIFNQSYQNYSDAKPILTRQLELEDELIQYSKVEIDRKYLVNDVYPEKEFEISGYTWIKNFYCVIITLNTHRFYWKRREITELTNFQIELTFDKTIQSTYNANEFTDDENLKDIIINYEQAKNFRSKPPEYSASDTTGNWIDYDRTYVKLGIPRDGIYRITYNEFQNYGVSTTNINPKTFKIFNKGNQIPLRVVGEEDFSFDQGDFIEFYATRNYDSSGYRTIVSLGQDYKNFMNRYTDTNFVFLTWGGANGQRNVKFNGTSLNSNDSLISHRAFLHLESDVRLWYYDNVSVRVNLPQWQENKVWTWLTLGRGGTTNIAFNASNIVPNSSVKSYVRLISNASNISLNAHKIGVGFNNNTVLDSVIFNFKQTANLFSTHNSSVLNNGSNQLRLFGMPTSASFYTVLIDWAEIEYLRFNHLANDSLYIHVPENVSTGIKAVVIYNASGSASDYLIYKLKSNQKFIENFNLINNTIVFYDTVRANDQFFIIKQNKVLTPRYYYTKQFVNLRSNQNAADYIIISNKLLQESVNSYKAFIDQNYNLRTKLVFVDDIFDEFGYGNPEAEAIQRFLKKAYDSWVSPAPSNVFLIGDANYDYKDVWTDLSFRRRNLVPSYGQPVSDSWYVMWDPQNPIYPQMNIGRLAARNNSEVLHYLSKHQAYLNKGFDDWNKRFLLFSGGDPTKLSELLEIRSKHQQLFDNVLLPSPVGGTGRHFYKTVNPNSNFGPFPPEVVQNAIDSGAVFISYIGHSGTQTWDNGIVNVRDLKNLSQNKKPLITDFGCSTGRFAEPDIESFGEVFTNASIDGQAIAYAGNSSFGYLSTSLRFPEYFYSQLLLDTVKEFGAAHNLAKIKQLVLTGTGDVNKVFTYCNILFGDPIIKMKVPAKPNLFINNSSIKINNNFPNDSEDSLSIDINFYNYGIVSADSFNISIKDFYKDSINFNYNLRLAIPRYNYLIRTKIPIKSKPGNHRLEIQLDLNNEINEIYEDDNYVSLNYNVFSTSVLPLEKEKFYISKKDSLLIINPSFKVTESFEQLHLQVSDNIEFNNPIDIIKNFDTLYSKIELPLLSQSSRYYWRIRVNSPNSQWSEVYSFSNVENSFDWYLDSTFRINDIQTQNVRFNPVTKSWDLDFNNSTLKIQSAGATAGKFATMIYNGQQLLSNTFFWGIVTARIDTITFQPFDFRYFVFPNPPSGDSLKAYIDNLPVGTHLVMAVSDDAAQSVLGFSSGTPVRNAIKTLGSLYIDSVMYRESWCMIGRKGAPIGSVPEAYKKRFEGIAEIEVSKSVLSDSGTVVFPLISNSSQWQDVFKNTNQPAGTNLVFNPLGVKVDGSVDSLEAVTFIGDSTNISYINPSVYPKIKLQAKLYRNQNYESPSINSLGVRYKGLPELATNYQLVKTNKDTVEFNDSLKINFGFMNLGEVSADSFKVQLSVIRKDNSERVVFDSLFTSLGSFESYYGYYHYKNDTSDGVGQLFFKLVLDYENKLKELSKLNNFYSIPFYAKPDTNTTSLTTANLTKVLFDDLHIYSGDYTSNNPEIRIEIKYGARYPVYDTTAIKFYLDNRLIHYNSMQIENDSATRTLLVKFKPFLSDGEHSLRIVGENLINKINSDDRYELIFNVSSELALIDLYNYPNPFKDKTYFTFRLPQIPDEVRIKIFTVAGRLIKEINVPAGLLNNTFNTIEWNGQDEDGNTIANGVYIYKVIIRKGDKVQTAVQKLAILK